VARCTDFMCKERGKERKRNKKTDVLFSLVVYSEKFVPFFLQAVMVRPVYVLLCVFVAV
jgi:hypothetical protein